MPIVRLAVVPEVGTGDGRAPRKHRAPHHLEPYLFGEHFTQRIEVTRIQVIRIRAQQVLIPSRECSRLVGRRSMLT